VNYFGSAIYSATEVNYFHLAFDLIASINSTMHVLTSSLNKH